MLSHSMPRQTETRASIFQNGVGLHDLCRGPHLSPFRASSRRNGRTRSRNGPTADPRGPRASPVQRHSLQTVSAELWIMMLEHLSKSFLVQQGSLGLVLCFGERRKRCEGGHPMREGKDPCGSIIVFNSNTVQRYHVLHLLKVLLHTQYYNF